MPLNGKQKRRLRALGHHLAVVVQVGGNGVTEGVIGAATQALKDHELIKVKIADDRDGRHEAVAALAKGTGAEVAQTLGRTVLLFKKRSKNSKFEGIFKLGASEPVAPATAAEPAIPDEDDSDDLPVALDAAEDAAPPLEVEADDQEEEADEGEGLAPEAPEEHQAPSEPTEAPPPKVKAVRKAKPKVGAKAKSAPKTAKPKSAKPKAAAKPRTARSPKAR